MRGLLPTVGPLHDKPAFVARAEMSTRGRVFCRIRAGKGGAYLAFSWATVIMSDILHHSQVVGPLRGKLLPVSGFQTKIAMSGSAGFLL